MKSLIFSILICLNATIIVAQKFKGTVIDKESNTAIPYVGVYFTELHTGTSTNDKGEFTIEHSPIKTVHIQISSIGYESIVEIINLEEITSKTFYLTPSHIGLDEVIVSSPLSKLQQDNIVNVEHRKLSELNTTANTNIAEAISNINGVEQNSTGVGIGKPVIRGLTGNRIVTYTQGIRVENQQWGSEHDLGESGLGIEGVEVIKGPASLLYGADALGGVLYFVDERYAEHNTFESYFESKYLSNTLGTQNNIGLKLHKENVKWNVFGNYTSNANYKISNGLRVSNTMFDQKNFKTSLGLDFKNWITNIRYGFLENNFGIAEGADFVSARERNLLFPYQNIQNHALSVENIVFLGKSRVNLTLGYTQNKRSEFEDSSTLSLGLKLNTLTYNLKWFSKTIKDKLNMIVGSQGMVQENSNYAEEVLIPDAQTIDLGVFTLLNYELKKIKLQGGIRYDHRQLNTSEMITEEGDFFPSLNKNYGNINFSAGAVYNLKKSNYRLNFASGFRAPNTAELLSDGVHHGATRYQIGDENLISERSYQADFTYQYKSEHFTFSLNPFVNQVENFIYLEYQNTFIDSFPAFQFKQQTALLFGGEAGFHYHPHSIHWLHLESNISNVFAQDINGNAIPMMPATRILTNVKIEFEKNKWISNFFIKNTYKLAQNLVGMNETPTPRYSIFDVGINGKIKKIEYSIGVKNILNTNYIDHLSRFKVLGIPNVGRNYFFALKIPFKQVLKNKSKS